MKLYLLRILKLIFGLFLFALGIALTIKADLGYAPWEVLHSGVGRVIGLQIGTVTILFGAIIVLVVFILKEEIGIGTILNMILIGAFMNIILDFNLIPHIENVVIRLILLICGLFTIALGSYFYMSSEFCAGPRDCLMVVLTKRTKLPIGVCRGIIEVLVVLIGWLLGGSVGIGTVISAFCIGFCIQITFKIFRFDAIKLKHENIKDTFKKISIRI